LQRQARSLEERIAAALQERQKYLDQLKATPEVRASPEFGRQRRQIDETGRSLAAVERQIDTLSAELRQVQAKLQGAGQAAPPAPVGRALPDTVMLDTQGHDRTYWRQRLEALQTRLRQAKEQRQTILAQLGAEEERSAFGRRGVEVLRQARTLDQINQEIRNTEAALEALRQEATRARAPAEWLQ
jgi:septation ring formation regulator EzrA